MHGKFCVSRHYGLFYVRGTAIYQSPHLHHGECGTVAVFERPIHHLLYDENYGISGRLLVFLLRSNSPMHQFINFEELPHFSDDRLHLDSSIHSMIVREVYQMLLGDDLVHQLLQKKMKDSQLRVVCACE